MIRERVLAGLEYAREHGTKSGRSVGRPKRIFDREQVFSLRVNGWSLRSIAKQLGLGLGTVVRTLGRQPRVQPTPELPGKPDGTLLLVPSDGCGQVDTRPSVTVFP